MKDRRGQLLILGQMLAGGSLTIFETDNKVLCSGGRIFLPKHFALATTTEVNEEFYVLKTVLGALAIRGHWHLTTHSIQNHVAECSLEFPGLPVRVEALAAQLNVDIWSEIGRPLCDGSKAPNQSVPLALDIPTVSERNQKITEIEGKGQSDVEVALAPDGDGPGAETPIHTFEKAETLEEANGLSRKTDDDDELASHEEALQSLEMRHVQRSCERPSSIYRSDIILDGLCLQANDDALITGLPYPEWDYQRREYRMDWCNIQPVRHTRTDPAWALNATTRHHPLIKRLKRQFASVTSDWQRLRRQPAGPEFDLDAVVEAEVSRRSGYTPKDTVYLDRKRDIHDVAAFILIDQSYSTDAWLHDARVLDTITNTLFCAGEVLTDYISSLAVASFSSNTRRSCHFSTIKEFHEPWATVRGRFGTLEPNGYTRIGPALRHAQELLLRVSAQRKVVIIITDGRPCDYDRYEGAYGLHDVKKAIETGAQHGIVTHAFAIEKQASECFPMMFTARHFDVISHPEKLTGALCQLFARIIAS
ncbi:MAG: VWA domain-containing protein [Verrucomicrobiota bacterium]|nr:VWA domain-containing protein [Verrucomicrobiota bacterium]